ncbi:MAG: PAC2 family protein [Endomicrobia bacterium]|nr:PAC2 family protein [Endomicrobiia bacterium]
MIIQKNNIKIKKPIIFCSWPEPGMVGNYVIDYIISDLKPTLYGEIDNEDYIKNTNPVVQNGITYKYPIQPDKIYYYKHQLYNFLFVSGTTTPSNNKNKFIEEIITFFQQIEASLIITFSGIPSNILHLEKPKIYKARTSNDIDNFSKIPDLEFGIIEGLNGGIILAAMENYIDAICIIAEIPFYTIEMNNPRTVFEILNHISKEFSLTIKLDNLLETINNTDKKIKEVFSSFNKNTKKLLEKLNIDKEQKHKEKDKHYRNLSGMTLEQLKKQLKFSLPQSAINKIKDLFKLASENIEYAGQLKKELDRWGVYKEYEDKFLSLFIKNKKITEEDNEK